MSLFATVPEIERGSLSDSDRARLKSLPTANIGDAMDRLGIVDGAIRPMWPSQRCVGIAHTVWTRAGDNRAIHEALETAQLGDVIVVSGQSDERRALIGELIAGRAKVKGVCGFVIDGAVRDVQGLEEYEMPVFARSETAAGPYKNGPGAVGATIAIGGVALNPGDVIVGDEDGVVVIPRSHLSLVISGAEDKRDSEQEVRDSLDVSLRHGNRSQTTIG